jgi:hypothetical protein
MEIGTEAAQFLFWENINGIFVAVCLETPGIYKMDVRVLRTVHNLLKTLHCFLKNESRATTKNFVP